MVGRLAAYGNPRPRLTIGSSGREVVDAGAFRTLRRVTRVAVIDESSPAIDHARVAYVMAAVILDGRDVAAVGSALVATLDRQRPFHWEREGVRVTSRFVERLSELPVRGHVWASIVHRGDQQLARTRLLSEQILPRVTTLGAGRLVIEQRSRSENDRDRRDVRDWFRDSPTRFEGIEHAMKSDPLTWMPDAFAGIWSDTLLGRGEQWLELLVSTRTLQTMSWDEPD